MHWASARRGSPSRTCRPRSRSACQCGRPALAGRDRSEHDIFQMAHAVFRRTKNIHVGSAVMNLVCNGGPIVRAGDCACSLHGMIP